MGQGGCRPQMQQKNTTQVPHGAHVLRTAQLKTNPYLLRLLTAGERNPFGPVFVFRAGGVCLLGQNMLLQMHWFIIRMHTTSYRLQRQADRQAHNSSTTCHGRLHFFVLPSLLMLLRYTDSRKRKSIPIGVKKEVWSREENHTSNPTNRCGVVSTVSLLGRLPVQ